MQAVDAPQGVNHIQPGGGHLLDEVGTSRDAKPFSLSEVVDRDRVPPGGSPLTNGAHIKESTPCATA